MTRIVFALAGFAGAAATLIAAAVVWLYLTQPALVADAISAGRPWSLVIAAAAAMISVLGRAIHRL